MTTAQKVVRFGATFAFALTIVAASGPSLAWADQDGAYDPSAAPFVLNTVSSGIQLGAGATEFGLGIGAFTSGEPGLGIGVAGTEAGAAAAGLGLGLPAGIVEAQP